MDHELEGMQLAVQLSREATAAGLTVTELVPMPCCGRQEFSVQLWTADNRVWTEMDHASAGDIREDISSYPR